MNVADFLKQRGVEFELIPHRDTFSAQRMAEELHMPGAFVAKTVLLRADRGYEYVVAVLPAAKRLDLSNASRALGGSRLEFATELEMLEHCPDCELGALPPFGSLYGMKTLVDEALSKNEWIVFEGNTHHDAIRIRFRDFQLVESPLIGKLTAEMANAR